MDSISKYVSLERDVAYMIGQDVAKEQEQTKFVTNLLTSSDFTVKKIAEIAGVSIKFVKKIQQARLAKK